MKVIIFDNESTILKIMSFDDSLAVKIAKVKEVQQELNHLFKKMELMNEENTIKLDQIPESIPEEKSYPEIRKKIKFCKHCNNSRYDRNGKPCRSCK